MSDGGGGGNAASLALDSRAMALLDRLLDATALERDAELAALHSTDPDLRQRVLRLLAAVDKSTERLAAPLHDALQGAGQTQGAGTNTPPGGAPIAGYRLLRRLGQGGMSTVWLAERADGQLKRQVAIKLPLAAHVSGVLAERFARERDVLAALDHPHIARLIDAGVAAAADNGPAGQPFIVLEYVAGRPITEHAESLSRRETLVLYLQVLDAVDHAHRHLTVHRDLKPSNILVDALGQVKLLDFGIAKLLAPPTGPTAPSTADLTQEGERMLTPRYAAPEQVLGAPVTTATDVYSAGVVLYELLTGRMPYGDAAGAGTHNIAHWMQAVTSAEPRSPGLSPDLDTVLLKALRKAPEDRYPSIERFAEDLRRLLAHQPILARRVPVWRRAHLLLRRHRRASAAVALGCAALTVAAAVAWHQHQESTAQKARADTVRDFVFSMVSDAEPAQGRTEVTGREMIDAAVARARSQFAGQPRLRGELLAELGRVYFRLRQTEAAVATLQESLGLLEAQAERDDPALNRTRAVLADALLRSDADRATRLARQALDECRRPGAPCAEARALAHYALAAAASWRGQEPAALLHARAMVAESETAQRADRVNLSLALEALATTARNQGALAEADQAITRAQAIAAQRPIKAIERARLNLLQSAIDIDLGRYAAARARLLALTQDQDATSEHALQWRMLASAELGLGRADAALAAAKQSMAMARPGAEAWFARQAWGQAALQAGRPAEGAAALAQAQAGLVAAGFPASSGSMLRLRRLQAEARLRQDSPAEAAALLQALVAEHAALVSPPRMEWGLALDALGCAALLAGQHDAAGTHFTAADERYASLLPADHALRLRNALLRALQAGDTASALARWRSTLAADSPVQQRPVADCRGVI